MELVAKSKNYVNAYGLVPSLALQGRTLNSPGLQPRVRQADNFQAP